MSVFAACMGGGLRIAAPFMLQIVKHLDQYVQDVHLRHNAKESAISNMTCLFIHPIHRFALPLVLSCLVAMMNILIGSIHSSEI